MNDAVDRLCLVTSDYHFREAGAIRTTSAFLRFVPELLPLARRIEVCAPVHAEGAAHGFSIESARVGYRPLPPSRTLEEFLRRFPRDGLTITHELYVGMRCADLIWINGPHPLLPLAALIARVMRKPYLLWLRGDILMTVRVKYAEGSTRDRLAARTAWYLDRLIGPSARGAAVFYTGSSLARYGRRAAYAQPANTSLVSEAQLAARPRTRVHAPLRLLWVGQLRPVKGLLHLLRALCSLRDEGQHMDLRLVGDGEQRDALIAEVAVLGLDDVVHLVGYVAPGPVLDAEYEEADVFVLPSLSEGIPKVLFEAMARALPVVATEVGGVPDVVCDGENGLLVRAGDAHAIA
nr:glycosyltransferase family 4 protein [Chloroflexota bacterium]